MIHCVDNDICSHRARYLLSESSIIDKDNEAKGPTLENSSMAMTDVSTFRGCIQLRDVDDACKTTGHDE